MINHTSNDYDVDSEMRPERKPPIFGLMEGFSILVRVRFSVDFEEIGNGIPGERDFLDIDRCQEHIF